MATLQFRNGSSRLLFQYEGKQQTLSIGDVGLTEARQWKSKAENLLMRVKQRMLEVPLGCTIQEFILHDGKPPLDLNVAKPRNITFDQLWDAYIKVYSNGAVEKNTLRTVKIHRKHLETTLGTSFLMPALTTGKLQEHIDRRCRLVGPITIKKEIDSFRAVWNWGKSDKRVTGDFPAPGLVYPKSEEKLPFMDWAEITRRVSAGGDADKLWDCLYLKEDEVEEFMHFAERAAAPDYMHPMLMTAAHAGARRSEMMRARLEDVDLANAKLTIREKKRKRGAYTTRRGGYQQEVGEGAQKADGKAAGKGLPFRRRAKGTDRQPGLRNFHVTRQRQQMVCLERVPHSPARLHFRTGLQWRGPADH